MPLPWSQARSFIFNLEVAIFSDCFLSALWDFERTPFPTMLALMSPGTSWKGWLVTQAGPLLTYKAHTVVYSCFLVAVPPIHTPRIDVLHTRACTSPHACCPHMCTCCTCAHITPPVCVHTRHMCTQPHMHVTHTCTHCTHLSCVPRVCHTQHLPHMHTHITRVHVPHVHTYRACMFTPHMCAYHTLCAHHVHMCTPHTCMHISLAHTYIHTWPPSL